MHKHVGSLCFRAGTWIYGRSTVPGAGAAGAMVMVGILYFFL